MTYKAVTQGQLNLVKKLARDKGVSREEFQSGLDNGLIASALDKLKAKPKISTGLLTEIATVEVPAVEKFVASERFGPNNPDGIKFYLDSNFEQYFLGKVEENVSAVSLAIHRLNRNSVDEPIRNELTPEREETTLTHFYELLKKQPKGENGILPTNGTCWIIAYIKDAKGNLWAVFAYCYSFNREWYVSAYSVVYPNPWSRGYQVVSRK